MRKIFLFLTVFFANLSFAQGQGQGGDDGILPESIEIIKQYEPVLADAVKIEFYPDVTLGDDGQGQNKNPVFNDYYVPNRFLSIGYDPVPLKPIGYDGKDKKKGKGTDDENIYHAWLRAGYGNLNTPFADLALSNGKSKKWAGGLQGSYISSSNKNLEFQDYSRIGAQAFGKIFLKNTYAGLDLAYHRDNFFYYGYDHADTSLTFEKDSLRQRYQTISTGITVGNSTENDALLDYSVRPELHVFSDNRDGRETNILLKGNATKAFNENLGIGLKLLVHQSMFKTDEAEDKDLLLNLTPSLGYKATWGQVSGGLSAILDSSKFYPAPYIRADFFAIPQTLTVYAEWSKEGIKNNYMNLAANNPFVSNELLFANSRHENRFVGIKGSIEKKISYNLKGFYNTVANQALYVNDSIDRKQFIVRYEPNMRVYGAALEVTTRFSERVKIGLQTTYNSYKGDVEEKMWHLPKLNINLRGEIMPIDKLNITLDFFALQGMYGLAADGTAQSIKTALDLNAAARFAITKNIGIFASVNNILSQKYERYLGYPVYGLNALGGLSVRF